MSIAAPTIPIRPSPSAEDIDRAATVLRLERGGRVGAAALEALDSATGWAEVGRAIRETLPDSRAGLARRFLAGRPRKGRAPAMLEALDAAEAIVAELPDEPEADTAVEKLVYATLADALAQIGTMEYAWDGYIPKAAMSTLAADAGIGKTLVALSICRCWWVGTPTMPDGSPNRYPPGTKTIWIMADLNFGETAEAAQRIGLPPEAIILNTRKESPVDLPDFDDPATIDALRVQAEELQPAMIVVDTITYATGRNTNRAEEAKVAFEPIIRLAMETGIPVLALAHLNAGGGVLGRRIVERVRSVISLSCPDPENQPNRRKLWVSKSAMKKPDALGITINDVAVEYDFDPPTAPDAEPKSRGPKPSKSKKMAEWLKGFLDAGPRPVVEIVEAARDIGLLPSPTTETPEPSISPLYNAKRAFPSLFPGLSIGEFRSPTPRTSKQLSHWRIDKIESVSDEGQEEDIPL